MAKPNKTVIHWVRTKDPDGQGTHTMISVGGRLKVARSYLNRLCADGWTAYGDIPQEAIVEDAGGVLPARRAASK